MKLLRILPLKNLFYTDRGPIAKNAFKIKVLLVLSALCMVETAFSQHDYAKWVDSVRSLKDDTTKATLLAKVGYNYFISKPDSGLYYSQQGLELARKLSYKKGEADCLFSLSANYYVLGNFEKCFELQTQALRLFRELDDVPDIIKVLWARTTFFDTEGDNANAIRTIMEAKRLEDSIGKKSVITTTITASEYEKANRLDSAKFYADKALSQYKQRGGVNPVWLFHVVGNVHFKMDNYDSALQYYHNCIPLAIEQDNWKDLMEIYNSLSQLYLKISKIDSSIYYARKALSVNSSASYPLSVLQSSSLLADAYKANNKLDSVVKYMSMNIQIKDSLFNSEKIRQVQNIQFNEQMRQQDIAAANLKYRNQVRIYVLIAALVVFVFVAMILWRNIRLKQTANRILKQQKEETEIQKAKLEDALEELRTTQTQLIQSAKMASLGELTAGIAHEIQNPLNFVNNFSEVSIELLDELKEGPLKTLPVSEAGEAENIVNALTQNLSKIAHHGKRADGIVKGMQQHSKANSGTKEPTDINALVEEYLRLSYHGLRAKDKNLNITLKTDFDGSIGKVKVIPQDIARVLVNVYNNAFYAVREKAKLQDATYEPRVTVTTKMISPNSLGANGSPSGPKWVLITVKDNGLGIPDNVVDKIFQPFFTTKPAGQGTGLGLSISYDIITKGHEGNIKAVTKEGEYTEFIIELPVN